MSNYIRAILFFIFMTLSSSLQAQSQYLGDSDYGNIDSLNPALVSLLNSDTDFRERYRSLFKKHGYPLVNVLGFLSPHWDSLDQPSKYLKAVADTADSLSSLDDVLWLFEKQPELANSEIRVFAEGISSAYQSRTDEKRRENWQAELAISWGEWQSLRYQSESVDEEDSNYVSIIKELTDVEETLSRLLSGPPSGLSNDDYASMLVTLESWTKKLLQSESNLVELYNLDLISIENSESVDTKRHFRLPQFVGRIRNLAMIVPDVAESYAYKKLLKETSLHAESFVQRGVQRFIKGKYQVDSFIMHMNSRGTPEFEQLLSNIKNTLDELRTIAKILNEFERVLPDDLSPDRELLLQFGVQSELINEHRILRDTLYPKSKNAHIGDDKDEYLGVLHELVAQDYRIEVLSMLGGWKHRQHSRRNLNRNLAFNYYVKYATSILSKKEQDGWQSVLNALSSRFDMLGILPSIGGHLQEIELALNKTESRFFRDIAKLQSDKSAIVVDFSIVERIERNLRFFEAKRNMGVDADSGSIASASRNPTRLLLNLSANNAISSSSQATVPLPSPQALLTPLPTNALYVRMSRNYGVAPVEDIARVVNKGSVFNQSSITFDDFAGSNISGIPRPADNESIKISFGASPADHREDQVGGLWATISDTTIASIRSSAELPKEVSRLVGKNEIKGKLFMQDQGNAKTIQLNHISGRKLWLRDYNGEVGVFTLPKPTHVIEIAIRAKEKAPIINSATDAVPLNVVFVVDVSGSMKGKKIEDAKQAIVKLYDQLLPNDSIGIVAFDDEVQTILESTLKSKLTKNHLSTVVRQLEADGGTDISLGVSFGIDEVTRYGMANTFNKVVLLTDGNPTSGEENWVRIRDNIAKKARGFVNVSIFGFGADANRQEMTALAGTTGGSFSFVVDPKILNAEIRSQVNRRNRLVALNLQVLVELPKNSQLIHFYGHIPVDDPAQKDEVFRDLEIAKEQSRQLFNVLPAEDIIDDDRGIRVFVPNIVAGETYLLVMEVFVPENINKKGELLGNVTVNFVDVLRKSSETRKLALTGKGLISANDVAEHAYQLWTSEVIYNAIEDILGDNFDAARDRIRTHENRLQLGALTLQSDELRDDRITLKKLGTLLNNIGNPLSFFDSGQEAVKQHTLHTLNTFSRSRSGYIRETSN